MARLMMKAAIVAGLLGASVTATPAAAQVNGSAAATAGSAQRRAILEAMRPAIENRLGPNIEFRISSIRVSNGWALVIAEPQRRGGGRIDPSRYFAPDQLEFMDGLTVNAVLRFRPRGWTLVDHAIGPTDVWYCGVAGLPRAIANC